MTQPSGPGKVLLQRYQVVRLVSQEGSMTVVCEVMDKKDSPPSTWTMNELWAAGNPDEYRDRIGLLNEEADRLKILSHKNIPRFRDRFDENGGVYLVLEYIALRPFAAGYTTRGAALSRQLGDDRAHQSSLRHRHDRGRRPVWDGPFLATTTMDSSRAITCRSRLTTRVTRLRT
jgi:serine/threonine protein kinase